MGTNSSRWDRDAYYASMSIKELETERDWWIKRISEHDHEVAREALAHIRMLIAERVGKKKQ